MRRREFIAFVGCTAAAWPLAARAQQPTIPVIGFLHLTSPETNRENLATFRRGLGETGYIEDKNVTIEYRWAQGRNDQLPSLAAELVHRQVSVIVVLESTNGALAAKAATQTIPIVFMQGADPVGIGLVNSLNRPSGNLTGISLLLAETAGKRLELLLELVPKATSIGYLRNPTNPVYAESETRQVEIAARAHGVRLLIVNASRPSEIETAFAELVQQRPDALQVASDGFLLTYPDQIVALAARYAVPAIYAWPKFAAVGGLISYGTNLRDAWRQAGIYTGRILKGEKPADLPVQQVTTIELVINLKTAKALGITVPLPFQLSALANELVAHRVAVIAATGGTASVLAAKAATSTIPIVFVTGGDPVQQGIVASLNQPGGNATGVSWLGNMLQSKQFETLHELVPNAPLFAALVNPDNPNFETDVRSLHTAADALGQKLLVVKATAENDIGVGFATIVQQNVGGLVVIGDPFLISQRERLVALAALHALPAIYPLREYAVAGGLMSYGASLNAAYRQVGVYVGRILNGDKPANLPVQQSTKVELVLNLKTAKALGLTVPLSLLNRADEVIE